MTFLAPDGGGASGVGSTVGKTGESSSAGAVLDVDALFKDIPLDELDSRTQQAITKIRDNVRTGIANLQPRLVDSPENKEKMEKLEKDLRSFQSRSDTLEAELRKLLGGKPAGEVPTEDEYLTKAVDVLRKSGFSEEEVKKNAPVYVNLLKSQLEVFQRKLGTDLRPMAGAVIMQEAQNAFESAMEVDSSGRLAIPEVAQKVWDQVKERATAGGQVNSELVINLAKIAYSDYADDKRNKGEEIATPQPRTPSNGTSMNTGGFTFPGATRVSGGTSSIVRQSDPNQPKHASNAETDAAVESTFRTLYRETGVAPKNLKSKFEPTRK